MVDDERDFWAAVPTRSVRRPRARATRPAPRPSATAQRRHGGHPVERRAFGAARSVDPFLLRLGLMIGAIVLLVPAAFSLRADAGTNILRTAPGVGAVALPAPVEQSVVAAATGAPTTVPASAAPETTSLDPASLPRAVPVVTEAASTTAASNSATSTAAAATAPPPAASRTETKSVAPTCDRRYEVVAGDYWILIARKVSVTTNELVAANNATAGTPLYPGRTVCLPAGASTPTTAATPVTTTAKVPTTTAPKASTTVAPSTTAAPTTTAAPRRAYSRTEVEAIIRAVWPDDLEDEALRIATRESNLQPTAKNWCCYGLFQIYYSVHKSWLAGIGVTSGDQLFDPLVNANAALAMYHRSGGWGPWRL